MAQATGYTCDVCNAFATSPAKDLPTSPDGWISVYPRVKDAARDERIDVCSNRCLAELGILRWECEPENDGIRFVRSREVKKPKQAANAERDHKAIYRNRKEKAAAAAAANGNGSAA